MSGKKISHYDSITQAARETGITASGISLSLRLPARLAGGFVCRVKGDRYYAAWQKTDQRTDQKLWRNTICKGE